MDNYVGKRLDGRYEIQEIIGVGGMSVVYKAYDNIDDRIVAVKILKEEFLANEEFRRRFKNESKAIAVMSHPNIVRVYDVNFGDRLQYIVMEYVDGITLKEYIQRQGQISYTEAIHFVSQILRALQHAHDKGIVHRDIKPQNIILLQNGNIKVTDFGIARFSRSDTRTMTEKAIGSVHYISPEQARGDMTDERADIYSVGVVLYEMITGTVPFESDSAVSVAIMQLQQEPKLPSEIKPDVPKGLEQITMHAMQKKPADRYQTATEMLLDIDELSRNPNAVFDYSFYVDEQPTKYMDVIRQAPEEEVDPGYNYEEYDQDYSDYDELEKKKTKKIIGAIALGALALIAAIVLLIMGLSGSFSRNKITLPNFAGYDYTEQIEGNYDLEFKIEYQRTDKYSAGSVITQDPAAGKKVKKGSTVVLTVASPEEEIKVPDVYGKTLAQAKSLLKTEKLENIEVKEVPNDDVETGLVISTSPARGTSMYSNDTLTIYISSGKENTSGDKIVMKSVIGLNKDEAKAFLVGAGISASQITFSTEDSTEEKDKVIAQTPGVGKTVTSTTPIKITISSGKAPTTASKAVTITLKTPNLGEDYAIDIYVNGEKQTTSTKRLNGDTYTYTIKGTGEAVKVIVEIKALKFSQTQEVNFTTGGSYTFDASNMTTTTTTTTKKEENTDNAVG